MTKQTNNSKNVVFKLKVLYSSGQLCPFHQVSRTTGTAVTVTRNCCIAWRAELLRIISRKTRLESPLIVVAAAVFPEDYGCNWIWIPVWRGQLALRSPVGRNHN